jgi:hypothetical protein
MNNKQVIKSTIKAVSAISAWACLGTGIYWIFTNPGSKAGADYNDSVKGAIESSGWILGSIISCGIYYASNSLFLPQNDISANTDTDTIETTILGTTTIGGE